MGPIVISQSAFEELQSADFVFTVDETSREFQREQYPIGIDDEGETQYGDYFHSFVAGEATAKHGELEIKFLWTANGGDKTYSDAFDFTIVRDRYSGKVCETFEEVIEFFGHGWLAKELYTRASIDDVVEVE